MNLRSDVSNEILCVGEVLWDSLPAGLFLGGAPFNVARHLRLLGLPATLVSRVGRDHLGDEALRRLARYGLSTELIQVDPVLPTGFVMVELDAQGVPAYDIVAPAAWDGLEIEGHLLAAGRSARAIVYGTLAQRGARSRETIRRLWELGTLTVCDVNLRPPYDDPEVVEASLSAADLVKLNEAEMRSVARWFGLPHDLEDGARALAERFRCSVVCVTMGGAGAGLLRDGRWSVGQAPKVRVVDTVGSGDAFLAGFLAAYLEGATDAAILEQANRLGAYVASRPGAIPDRVNQQS